MKSHDFIINGADTDAISFCKKDQSPFTEEEQLELLYQINKILPEYIVFEDDGYFSHFLILKAKNYIMKEEGSSLKKKGS